MPLPLYYASVAVDGVANTESLEEILNGTEEEPKLIHNLWFVEVTAGGEQDDAQIAAYIEREQIIDAPIEVYLNAFDTSASQPRNRVFELNHPLKPGETFKVGHTSGATASDMEFVVSYSIE